MYSLRRQNFRNKAGEAKQSLRWQIRFSDHHGVRRPLTAFTDERASREFGRNLDRLAGHAKAGGEVPEDLRAWAEGLDDATREKLTEWGLTPATNSPLAAHVEAYRASLLALNKTKAHADLTRTRLTKVFSGCRFIHWRQLDSGKVEAWLAEQRGAGRMKMNTSNHFGKTIDGFVRWMIDTRRAAVAPPRIRPVTVTDEESYGAFTVEQVEVLLAYCEQAQDVWAITQRTAPKGLRRSLPSSYVTGPERAFIYRMAVETGQRAGTLRKVTVGNLRIERDHDGTVLGGVLKTTVGQQKTEKAHDVPLRPGFAAELAERSSGKDAAELLIQVPTHTAAMLQHDLNNAGLPLKDEDDSPLAFHSFRHTTATWLGENGATEREIQAVTGHASSASVSKYTHLTRKLGQRAVQKLPPLNAGIAMITIPNLAPNGANGCSNGHTKSPSRYDKAGWGGRAVECAGLENR